MTDSRARICVLGSINMDLVVRAPRLPAPGETVLGATYARHPGGKGANQAAAAAKMGAHARMIGLTGDDDNGRAMRDALAEAGVDTAAIESTPDAPTGVALITVDAAAENTIVVASGANALLAPQRAEVAAAIIQDADVLLMQLETPIDTVARAAQLAKDADVTVILNAAPAPTDPLPDDLLQNIDILIVNEGEARAVARGADHGSAWSGSFAPTRPPTEDAPEAQQILHPTIEPLLDLGPGAIIVTLGAEGAAFAWQRDPGAAPSFKVEPVDTVGAGDAFCGAFACRWAELRASGQILDRMSMIDALSWACAAGALATTRPGAIPSLPTRAETLALLKTC